VISPSVAIELLSDRMDVAAIRSGHVVGSRRITVSLPAEPISWVKAVRGLSTQLAAAVRDLGIPKGTARVLYRSPTQTVDLASFDLRSADQACAAATLPTVEALPYQLNSAVIETVAVGRDASGPQRRWHVVVAADRIDVVRALVEMVEAAGLMFESATPMDAAIMSKLIRQALRHAGPQHGWLHFGQNSSFFILGGGGRVRFKRSIGLGVETVVQSLARPIRVPDEEAVQLDQETARLVLHEHGIPETDEVVVARARLTRQHIMPQIQPVLQRYVVELRQSLRFGLPEDDRKAIEITVTGPGGTIPGLIELMGWELQLKFAVDPRYAVYNYREPAGPGSELRDAAEDTRLLSYLSLQPQATAQVRQMTRLRKWLWCGAAATMGLIATDALRLQMRLGMVRDQAETLQRTVSELNALGQTKTKVEKAMVAMHAVEKLLVEEIGARADMRAVLQELARLTPASVRLNTVRLSIENRVTVAKLYGRALQHANGAGKTAVEPFIDALRGSPLFRIPTLRNVERVAFPEGPGERFEASFELILAPESPAPPVLAAGAPDASSEAAP
jgi:Tfp pilus assembly PilM family ATPase/Tfp pilus assembly protein PilN